MASFFAAIDSFLRFSVAPAGAKPSAAAFAARLGEA